MKSILYSLVLLSAIGCGTKERYVHVVADVQPKTAMVTIEGIAERTTMEFTKEGMTIHTGTAPVKFGGSAVFITRTGVLLTCAHLFDLPVVSTITVTSIQGTQLVARMLTIDFGRDLALLKVDGLHDAATMSHRKLRPGQEVIAVGNPHGLDFSTTHGIISHIDRDIGDGFYFTQIDAPINPGNSGGPLFNLDGELIGINARIVPGDGMGFAVSPSVIDEFLAPFRGIK